MVKYGRVVALINGMPPREGLRQAMSAWGYGLGRKGSSGREKRNGMWDGKEPEAKMGGISSTISLSWMLPKKVVICIISSMWSLMWGKEPAWTRVWQ